ncbi:hypothetical protein D3C84_1204830 [compost metagenome]
MSRSSTPKASFLSRQLLLQKRLKLKRQPLQNRHRHRLLHKLKRLLLLHRKQTQVRYWLRQACANLRVRRA